MENLLQLLNQGEITVCHSRGQNAQVFFMCCRTSYGSQIILAHMVPLKVVKVFMTLKVEAVSTLKTIIFAWYGL